MEKCDKNCSNTIIFHFIPTPSLEFNASTFKVSLYAKFMQVLTIYFYVYDHVIICF